MYSAVWVGIDNIEVGIITMVMPSIFPSPPPLCGAISADDKYKCKPADQVRAHTPACCSADLVCDCVHTGSS